MHWVDFSIDLFITLLKISSGLIQWFQEFFAFERSATIVVTVHNWFLESSYIAVKLYDLGALLDGRFSGG